MTLFKKLEFEQVNIVQVDLSDLGSVHRFCWEFNENEKDLYHLDQQCWTLFFLVKDQTRLQHGDECKLHCSLHYDPSTAGQNEAICPESNRILTSHMPFVADAIPCMDRTRLDLTGEMTKELHSQMCIIVIRCNRP